MRCRSAVDAAVDTRVLISSLAFPSDSKSLVSASGYQGGTSLQASVWLKISSKCCSPPMHFLYQFRMDVMLGCGERRGTEGANMSKSRHHRRSKMKRRGVKNGSQNGSKMAPKWLQNGSLEASGRPLGALGLALGAEVDF